MTAEEVEARLDEVREGWTLYLRAVKIGKSEEELETVRGTLLGWVDSPTAGETLHLDTETGHRWIARARIRRCRRLLGSLDSRRRMKAKA